MFTNKIFLVLSTFGAFFISSIAIAQSNSLPNSLNPNVPEELHPPKEPTYKANSEKKLGSLNLKSLLNQNFQKKQKLRRLSLKSIKTRFLPKI